MRAQRKTRIIAQCAYWAFTTSGRCASAEGCPAFGPTFPRSPEPPSPPRAAFGLASRAGTQYRGLAAADHCGNARLGQFNQQPIDTLACLARPVDARPRLALRLDPPDRARVRHPPRSISTACDRVCIAIAVERVCLGAICNWRRRCLVGRGLGWPRSIKSGVSAEFLDIARGANRAEASRMPLAWASSS